MDGRLEKVWLYEEDLGMKPEGSDLDQFEATACHVRDVENEESKPTHVELVGSALVLEETGRDSSTPKLSEESTIHVVQPSLMLGLQTTEKYLDLLNKHQNVSLNFKSKNDAYSKSPVSTNIQFRKIAPKPTSTNELVPMGAVKAPNTTASLHAVKTIKKTDILRMTLLKEPAKKKKKASGKYVLHKKPIRNDYSRPRTNTTIISGGSNSKSNVKSDVLPTTKAPKECNVQLLPMRLRSGRRKLASTTSKPSALSATPRTGTTSTSSIAPRPILPAPLTPVSTTSTTIMPMPLPSQSASSMANTVGSGVPPQQLTYTIPVQTSSDVHLPNVQQFPSVEMPYAAQPQMPSNATQFCTPNIVQQYQMSSNIVQTFQTQSCITPIINTSIVGQEFEMSNSFQHCEMHSNTVQQIQTSNVVGMHQFDAPSNLVQQTQTSNIVGLHQVTTQTNTVHPVLTTADVYSQHQVVNDPVQTPRMSKQIGKGKHGFCKILPRPPTTSLHSSSSGATRTYSNRQRAPVKITNALTNNPNFNVPLPSRQSATKEIPLQCFRCFKNFPNNKCLLQHLQSHFSKR